MGWWQIGDKRGGIAAFAGLTPLKKKKIPLLNGDEPADIMDSSLDKVLHLSGHLAKGEKLCDKDISVSKAALANLYFEQQVDPSLGRKRKTLLKEVTRCWEAIKKCYQRNWERDPFPEEQEAVFNFCCPLK